jgi:CheY-like chemotaxis protein
MGGEIAVESEVGRGSAFSVTLPFDLAPHASPCAPDDRASTCHDDTSLRVLVLTESRVLERLLAHHTETHGHTLRIAQTAAEAAALVGGSQFDVFLVDETIPARETARAIEAARAGVRETTPIVIGLVPASLSNTVASTPATDGRVQMPPVWETLAGAIADARLARAFAAAQQDGGGIEADRHPTLSPDVDVELFGTLADLFMTEEEGWLRELGDAVARRDAPALARVAHTVKGALGVFTTGGPWKAAHRLEALGRGARLDEAAAALDTLVQELDRLRPALAASIGAS